MKFIVFVVGSFIIELNQCSVIRQWTLDAPNDTKDWKPVKHWKYNKMRNHLPSEMINRIDPWFQEENIYQAADRRTFEDDSSHTIIKGSVCRHSTLKPLEYYF